MVLSQSYRTDLEALCKLLEMHSPAQMEHQNGEKLYFNDFGRGMVVDARQSAVSISETADLLGFFTHYF